MSLPATNNLRPLFLLRPDVIFLNHGSFGACPQPVFDTYRAWQLELERQPVEFLGRRFNDLMRDARRSLGAYLNADAQDLVFVPNTTTGLNIVARSLRLEPGDEILSNDQEYGALDRTWRFLCRRSGARYIRRPIPLPIRSADEVIDAIWSGVTERTRVLFISHITSPTAIVFPIAPLLERARAAGIITVIDGAHAPGQLPLDLAALGADFYSGNCHKWMIAPKGSAFLYARREMQHLVEPLVVSWGWESIMPGDSRFIDEQEYQGTRDIAAYLSVPAAIEFMRQHSWEDVRAECQALLHEAHRQLSALPGLVACTPSSPEWLGQMAAFALPPCDGKQLQRRLYDEYKIEIPVGVIDERQFLRISLQGYNSPADVDALVEALRVLLPQVV
ncbi:MAG TPA: aminotransferase class V-fold PLP-dependent enzyme [Herpetosiphonaceae bacterium]